MTSDACLKLPKILHKNEWSAENYNMSCDVIKPVFGVSDLV